MGLVHRYRTAWSRLRRSRGFGIHSPFAFRFVLDVLCERLPYYAYGYIDALRQAVVDEVRTDFWNHPRVISSKNAKMVFRITNYFNPPHILQLGTSYGVSTACMLVVNSASRVLLYEPHLGRFPVIGRVLQPFLDRVTFTTDLGVTLDDYFGTLGDGEPPFVLINDLPYPGDLPAVTRLVQRVIDNEGVIVMRNISRSDAMAAVIDACRAHGDRGQLFTNGRIAVMVALRRMPREEFQLWF